MSKRLGVVFPGQGSQAVGMGADIAAKSSAAKALFDRANDVLGYDLFALIQNGPDERLRETRFSQPAIFVTNLALYEAGRPFTTPIVSAGHSFAEFCSLTIADAIAFDGALRVVAERANAMQAAAEAAPGGMAAVLGLNDAAIRAGVERVRRDTGMRLQLANFNSPTQIVISGDRAAIAAANDVMLEAGAKRVVDINVSGAWHSELMEPAIPRFARAVESARIEIPKFAVVSNVTAKPYTSVQEIRENLVRSITSEVRWHDASLRLLEFKPDLIVEFSGDKGVMAPLFRRIPNAPEVLNVSDSAGVERLRAALNAPVSA
ncbi:MAG: ACP S-malonyltransferase [Candidatus Eremiobacteraeota bacterium]|nr:ACP S-malonyltransferase [Candidatus Eremiobacteraeota bacterium]